MGHDRSGFLYAGDKPNLPLASREFSIATRTALVTTFVLQYVNPISTYSSFSTMASTSFSFLDSRRVEHLHPYLLVELINSLELSSLNRALVGAYPGSHPLLWALLVLDTAYSANLS